MQHMGGVGNFKVIWSGDQIMRLKINLKVAV